MSEVTVYIKTQSKCPQCDATLRRFKKHGVEPNVKSVEEHMNEALEHLPGAQSAPIVTVPGNAWSGFNLTKIDQYAATLK